MTNFETLGSIFRFSSAVFNVTGIVAIELAVEKDTVCGLRNFENVEDIGLFATNFKIKTYTDNMIARPSTTVAMYTPKPAIDSKPILETMPTIKPKTANGTIFMENNKIFNVIF